MQRRKKKWKPSKETKRWIIILVSAFVLAVVSALISQFLDRPVESYYPHDDARATQ